MSNYGNKLIVNSIIRTSSEIITKVLPIAVSYDLMIFDGEKIVKPIVETISKTGGKIKSKFVKNSNIQ